MPRIARRRSQYAATASIASNKETSGSAPNGMTEQPPPPPPLLAGAGAAFAEPEMLATAGAPPMDRPSDAVPLYAPVVAGVTVTVTVQFAPAASVVLLQLSTEAAMIAGCDSDSAPTLQEVGFGLVKLRLTVVDCPTLTVAAVAVGVVVVKDDPVTPVRLTKVGDAAPTSGSSKVAVCAAAAEGV